MNKKGLNKDQMCQGLNFRLHCLYNCVKVYPICGILLLLLLKTVLRLFFMELSFPCQNKNKLEKCKFQVGKALGMKKVKYN